jgi:formylglycine-generating enzyme required for sulfatase activity
MRFVLIPAGEFEMGSSEAERAAWLKEHPNDKAEWFADQTQHRVRLTKAYYLSLHEVTNAEYRRFKASHDSGVYGEHSLNGDRQPVVRVSHEDAVSYAAWLSKRERGRSYRLPTEAEWEHACRAGSTTRFWWGASEADGHRYANISGWPTDDGHRVTAPVGSYLPNGFGLYDMAGNVWEWCSDWYGETYYAASPRADPQGPATGEAKLLRGGSWNDIPWNVRSASRRRDHPSVRGYDYGFRLLLSLPAGR